MTINALILKTAFKVLKINQSKNMRQYNTDIVMLVWREEPWA